MKTKEGRVKVNMEHRGNNKELLKQFELQMKVVHSVPESYYTTEGEIKHVASKDADDRSAKFKKKNYGSKKEKSVQI